MTTLEALALEAATTLNATDNDLTQRAAYNIEVEIDSYRPIKNGEHLVLIPVNWQSTIEIKVSPSDFKQCFLAWGTENDLRDSLSHSAFLWYTDFDPCKDYTAEEIKQLVTKLGGYFGTLEA